ncbi:hypothetical protein OG223_50275 [Streptomyces sp. NBC_01478]|jgi:glutaminase|uniref:hypothetical protein n=1 Tax=Streptomyces sp. NBC_01478 TaxID=2903882 RepID=UPI002E2F1F05|nr:hypothetical protein [Streptomyces sp. NBC_01478]
MASTARRKEQPATSAAEPDPFEAAYRALFDAFDASDDDGSQTLSRDELVTILRSTGLLEDV